MTHCTFKMKSEGKLATTNFPNYCKMYNWNNEEISTFPSALANEHLHCNVYLHHLFGVCFV